MNDDVDVKASNRRVHTPPPSAAKFVKSKWETVDDAELESQGNYKTIKLIKMPPISAHCTQCSVSKARHQMFYGIFCKSIS